MAPVSRPEDRRVEGVAVGRVVHFVVPDGQGYRVHPGSPRPHLAGIITQVWNPDSGYVNLTVFPDGTNQFDSGGGNIATSLVRWETSVLFDASADPAPRTWHFPERV